MASSQTPPDPNPDETSYIKMPPTAIDSRGTDASLVGAHCQYAYCNQLDFLPFRCQSCEKTFCLEHRTEDGHACARAGAWAARRRQAELARPAAGEGSRRMRGDLAQKKPCADDGCRAVVGTSLAPAVHCPGCNRDYCMKHRLREDHGCAGKTPIGARPSAADGARNALERLRLWGQAKREQAKQSFAPPRSSRQQSRTAQLLAVNTLKKTAKGDTKLPPEKRVYLYVEAEASTAKAKIPKGEFFYSQDWVVGKMLDAAARSLQVQNVNNQSDDEQDKLRVFHVEGGRLLDFNEKLGTVLQSGNTVVLLRGVGPPPDLLSL